MLSPKSFEKLISEMIGALRSNGSSVEHNARIVDRDTGIMRQVDILVRQGDKNLHYECRHHAGVQDVKWIEELIGRKLSLRVDEMIAVSSSGFSAPAIAKARTFSIGMLDMRDVSPDSIQDLPSIYCKYLSLSNLIVHFGFGRPTDSIKVFDWFSKAKFNRYENFENFIEGLRNYVPAGRSRNFWVAWPNFPRHNFLQGAYRIFPRRAHVSGIASCVERTWSTQSSSALVDVLLSKWLGDVHSFGIDGCHFIKTLDVERFMVNFAIINAPVGSAMTEIAFHGGGIGPVNISGNLRDLRKPPQNFSVEVSFEDRREYSVHRAFQMK